MCLLPLIFHFLLFPLHLLLSLFFLLLIFLYHLLPLLLLLLHLLQLPLSITSFPSHEAAELSAGCQGMPPADFTHNAPHLIMTAVQFHHQAAIKRNF